MNKLKLYHRILLISFFSATSVMAHMGEDHTVISPPTDADEVSLASINSEYKQRIRPIFVKKCFDCHSSKTSFPWYYKVPFVTSMIDADIRDAKKHLNMDGDFPFKSHGTPKADLKAIGKSISEETMPPLNYVFMHGQSRLTESEKKTVRDWVEFSLLKLNK